MQLREDETKKDPPGEIQSRDEDCHSALTVLALTHGPAPASCSCQLKGQVTKVRGA